MHRTIAVVWILVICFAANAQDTTDFTHYDNKSLALYQSAEWSALISLGKEALYHGHDYYYLRMRIGIAYYERKNYLNSIPHFTRALEFDEGDPVALEYLYYCYLFSGQKAEALLLFKQNKVALDTVNAKPTQIVQSVYTEGGTKIKNNETEEVGPIHFWHAGLSHQLSPSVSIYQGYSFLSQRFSTFTEASSGKQGSGQGQGQDSPGNSAISEKKATYLQHEYYVRANVRPARGWQLISAYHYQLVDESVRNYAISGGVTKNVSLFQLYGAIGYAQINELEQKQGTAGLIIYPKGNLNLYLLTYYTLHEQNDIRHHIIYQKLGTKLSRTTWLEASYALGEMQNIIEMDAFYVQNIPDIIKSKMGVSFIQLIHNRYQLSLGYLMENKEISTTGENYIHHAFWTGLNISF